MGFSRFSGITCDPAMLKIRMLIYGPVQTVHGIAGQPVQYQSIMKAKNENILVTGAKGRHMVSVGYVGI